MTSRSKGQTNVLSRRVSIYDATSPPRRKSPLFLPRMQRDKTPTQRRGPSPTLTWAHKRTASVDTVCTSATSGPQSLLASKDTPLWGKTQKVPFPGAAAAMIEERNVIATPSSTGEPAGLYNVSLDESLGSYIRTELAPKSGLARKRFQCPTPVPIASVTPDLNQQGGGNWEVLAVKVQTGKSPKTLSRPKPLPPKRTLKLPAVTSPQRGAISPLPARNISPLPFRAQTDMRVRPSKKPDRRSPLHVR